jgi:hypothetical protein
MAQTGTDIDLSRARWHKSSHSNGGEGACVEVADNLPGIVAVRDSNDPHGPSLVFTSTVWRTFIHAVRGKTHEG